MGILQGEDHRTGHYLVHSGQCSVHTQNCMSDFMKQVPGASQLDYYRSFLAGFPEAKLSSLFPRNPNIQPQLSFSFLKQPYHHLLSQNSSRVTYPI